jgi:hypothetical protein
MTGLSMTGGFYIVNGRSGALLIAGIPEGDLGDVRSAGA